MNPKREKEGKQRQKCVLLSDKGTRKTGDHSRLHIEENITDTIMEKKTCHKNIGKPVQDSTMCVWACWESACSLQRFNG